jgi:hypothetical protein
MFIIFLPSMFVQSLTQITARSVSYFSQMERATRVQGSSPTATTQPQHLQDKTKKPTPERQGAVTTKTTARIAQKYHTTKLQKITMNILIHRKNNQYQRKLTVHGSETLRPNHTPLKKHQRHQGRTPCYHFLHTYFNTLVTTYTN